MLSRDKIRDIFLESGFTIKEGQTDLKEYVFDAAYKLICAVGLVDWCESETPELSSWKNPLFTVEERLQIVDGAVSYRDRVIKQLRERLSSDVEEDAARYRWLCEHGEGVGIYERTFGGDCFLVTDPDKVIDGFINKVK